jgi:pheromone shutdown protein TraB
MENHNILEKVLVIFETAVGKAMGKVEKKDNEKLKKQDNEKLKKQLRYLSTNLNKKMLEEADKYMNPEEITDILKKMMD